MRKLAKLRNVRARALRAGLSRRLLRALPARGDATRRRRGALFAVPAEWRRCEMGTNHIASFGVWREGTRRMAERHNRTGATRWHKPYRGGVALALPTFGEAVNED
jgi:hypothetical protein